MSTFLNHAIFCRDSRHGSGVYKWKSGSFQLYQKISTREARAWKHFTIDHKVPFYILHNSFLIFVIFLLWQHCVSSPCSALSQLSPHPPVALCQPDGSVLLSRSSCAELNWCGCAPASSKNRSFACTGCIALDHCSWRGLQA